MTWKQALAALGDRFVVCLIGALASPPPLVEGSAAAAAAAAQNAAAATTTTTELQQDKPRQEHEEEVAATQPKSEEKQAAAAAGADAAADRKIAPPPDQQAERIAPALPLAIVFDTLLEQKILGAVDLCELGCVCSQLALCVRQFWTKAEAHPGSQRRLLFVADDRQAGLRGRLRAREWLPAYRSGKKVITRALEHEPCSCCGREFAPFQPWSYTYPYPFDGAWPALEPRVKADCFKSITWGGFVLCRSCYRDTTDPVAPPHHSRQERFRLKEWDELVEMYDTPLPVRILSCAVKEMRPVSATSRPVFAHMRPRACMVRAANFALTLKTPRELHAQWRRRGR